MALRIGSQARRYGALAQADNFGGLACAPTSVANALLALGVDSLMQVPDQPGSWQSLYDTRNILAEEYFFTSKAWDQAISLNPSLPSPSQVQPGYGYNIAPGSPPSMILKGTIDYIAKRKAESPYSTPVTINAAGLNQGFITYPGGQKVSMNFGAFEAKAVIDGTTVTSPSVAEYSHYFSEISEGDSRGVLDFLLQGLLRGPVVFGMYYTDSPSGHAVLATDLQIDDSNSNGIIERGEATITFIDPLNPSNAYSPGAGTFATEAEFDRIKSAGSTYFTTGDLWQDTDGYLTLSYEQRSLAFDTDTQQVKLFSGDSSNNRIGVGAIQASISIAMSLNTSGLAPDFDRQAGALSTQTPGLIDFSFLLDDPFTTTKRLSGYVYSNESSSFANLFSYYEALDTSGTIEARDPLTGQQVRLSPGDAGYNDAAWVLAQNFTGALGAATLGTRESTDQETLTSFELDLGGLASGYIIPVSLTSAGDIWTPYAFANIDREQHFMSTGPLSWRMEDVGGLGDRDFNDLHVSLLIESIL